MKRYLIFHDIHGIKSVDDLYDIEDPHDWEAVDTVMGKMVEWCSGSEQWRDGDRVEEYALPLVEIIQAEPEYGPDLYVDAVLGDDTYNGLSWGTPKATIAQAQRVASEDNNIGKLEDRKRRRIYVKQSIEELGKA